MKISRVIAFGVAALVALLAIVIGVVVATFDPNAHKTELVQWVKARYGRDLAIDGRIELTFFPRIGVAAHGISLSERSSPQPFATTTSARVSVALLPLLARKVLVDRIELDGLDVGIVKHKDGRTNFDDLLGRSGPAAPRDPGPSAAPPLVVDISGIRLRNAAIGYHDEAAGTALRLSKVELVTDRIASGAPGKVSFSGHVKGDRPQLDADVRVNGGYRIEFDGPAVRFDGIDAQLTGEIAGRQGLKVSLTADEVATGERVEIAKLKLEAAGTDGLEAKLVTPRLMLGREHSESAPIDATLKMAQANRRVDARIALAAAKSAGPRLEVSSAALTLDAKTDDVAIQGKLATPLRLDFDAGQVALTNIAGNFTAVGPDVPNRSMQLALGGRLLADWTKKSAQAELEARFDESNARLRFAIADFARPAPQFDLAVDKLDLGRYAGAAVAAGGNAPAKSADGRAQPTAPSARDAPLDLSALKTINASGRLHVGSLTVERFRARDVDIRMQAANGVVRLDPVAAQLYEGSTSGAASIDANGNRLTLRQQFSNVSVGPLLRDLAEKDVIEGRGTLALDIATGGNVLSALKRGLNGKASLQLRDGAIKGVDLGAIVRQASSLRSGNLVSAVSPGSEKTDFTELSATFVLRNGVAHNDDLSAKSPFVRASGAGDIDIGSGSIDYLVKATIVATPTGQEGKALVDLRGVTVPVRLSGPFDAVKYTVDAGALAAELARSQITRQLGDKVPKGALDEVLKGLLRR